MTRCISPLLGIVLCFYNSNVLCIAMFSQSESHSSIINSKIPHEFSCDKTRIPQDRYFRIATIQSFDFCRIVAYVWSSIQPGNSYLRIGFPWAVISGIFSLVIHSRWRCVRLDLRISRILYFHVPCAYCVCFNIYICVLASWNFFLSLWFECISSNDSWEIFQEYKLESFAKLLYISGIVTTTNNIAAAIESTRNDRGGAFRFSNRRWLWRRRWSIWWWG